MKKKIIVLALFVLLISGCGSKIPTLSNGDEAVATLKKGSMMISANELYQSVKNDYALESMVNLVDKKILEDKYKDKVEEAQKAADNTITEYQSYYGDQLLSLIQQQTGYQTIEGFKESLYINNLQKYAIDDYSKAQISDKEIKKYYNDEVVGDIKVSHILITAKVKDDMTDEEKAAAEATAKKKVESIISELNKTDKKEITTKFSELAKAQSEDDSTKDNGGSLGWINKDTLSSEYDELVTAAYKLKDGEYSTSVITTEQGYHVILRNGTKEKASLDDSKDKIVEALAKKYLEENPVANVKALQEVRKEYKLEIVDSELKEQYANYIQNQISYYQQSVSTNE